MKTMILTDDEYYEIMELVLMKQYSKNAGLGVRGAEIMVKEIISSVRAEDKRKEEREKEEKEEIIEEEIIEEEKNPNE